MAKLILTHEVTGLGAPGDVVEVKDGYARNFLVPRGLATAWSKGAEKQVTSIRKARKAREIATLDEAKAIRDALQSKPVVVRAKSGDSGRLFGADHDQRDRRGRQGCRRARGRQAQGRGRPADQGPR